MTNSSNVSTSSTTNMHAHFHRWGWVTLLRQIAEAGIFSIHGNGLNAIDNAKAAPLYQVLTYASEKKDYNEMFLQL